MSSTVAVGSIFTECNHLGGAPTDLAAFERQELRRGDEVLQIVSGTVGGMLATLREGQAAIKPLIVASTCPGGPLTPECYTELKSELLAALRNSLPVSGVLLALHGSAAADNAGDLEGDLLEAVRQLVGPDIPVVATLDLHAHVTAQMVQNADALLAWETYPHRDAYTTGVRGARLLLDTLAGHARPAMALAKVPVIVSGVHGHTDGPGPFADTMRYAKSLEQQQGVLSTSALLVHPYLDLPDMGGGGIVITNGDMDRAAALAGEIAERYWQRRFELDPPVCTPADAIARGLAVEGGPVLLVEASDCCGGGAAGDSIATLRALLEAGVRANSLVPVVDPDAAGACHCLGAGAEVELNLGHALDPRWGAPLALRGTVRSLSDGRFRYSGGIFDGQEANMGPTAVVEIGGIQILIATHATYDWRDEQFRSQGLDPAAAKFIVVKNPMNYRQTYDMAKAVFILDTPGPTPPVLHHVRFRNVKRPYYPADKEIPGLRPMVVRGRSPR